MSRLTSFLLVSAISTAFPLLAALSSRAIHSYRRPSHQDQVLPDLTRYVNPFIGTIRDGNTFPGAAAPFGMVQWSPDTSAGGLSKPGGYSYGDLIIRGFSLTHLSGAGCAAFENIPFLPTVRPLSVPPAPNGSPYSDRFRHRDEQASPGYYAVRLASGIQIALTITPRTGLGVFRYPSTSHATLLIDPGSSAGATSNIDGARNAAVQIAGDDEVMGWASSGGFCRLQNRYTVYFAARFDRPFTGFGTWSGAHFVPGARDARGPHAGAYLQFDTRSRRTVEVQVGLSYVSIGNALANLRAEEHGWSLPAIRAATQRSWNALLNRIQATGGTPAEEVTFYTALYHALLHPNVFDDANGQYLGFDGRVHHAAGYTQYANFSDWDIYRSEIPLLAWIAPHQTGDMMQSLVADAEQSGRLPRWPVANAATGEMDGDSVDPVIASAYAFGAQRFAAGAALRFMLKGASVPGAGPGGYQERPGLADYLRQGYVPPQTGGYGAAAVTLEYAVDDFAIARLARALGNMSDYDRYAGRAENWRHLFNPRTGFLQPRMADGHFLAGFQPSSMDGFVEGNAWQYRWMVPQNLPGLFRALGGNRAVVAALDRFFQQLNAGPQRPYYWAGNEPDLEVPWEYDFAGAPQRTQAVVRRIITSQYGPHPGDLPGNDDLGEMSSWYVWAAMGLYPEIPGVPGLAVGSPLFPRITLHLAHGHRLTIVAPRAAASRPLVRELRLNGRPYQQSWLLLRLLHGDDQLMFNLASGR